MSSYTYNLINAFVSCDTPPATSGNPAAVIIFPAPSTTPSLPPSVKDIKSLYPADDRLHSAAKELDQPMTSFLVPLSPSAYALRWFSSAGESPMCGHGTVAAASKLFSNGVQSPVTLFTPTATLSADKIPQGVAIQLPADTATRDVPAGTEEVLSSCLDSGNIKPISITAFERHNAVELDERIDLQSVNVDLRKLVRLANFAGSRLIPSRSCSSYWSQGQAYYTRSLHPPIMQQVHRSVQES